MNVRAKFYCQERFEVETGKYVVRVVVVCLEEN